MDGFLQFPLNGRSFLTGLEWSACTSVRPIPCSIVILHHTLGEFLYSSRGTSSDDGSSISSSAVSASLTIIICVGSARFQWDYYYYFLSCKGMPEDHQPIVANATVSHCHWELCHSWRLGVPPRSHGKNMGGPVTGSVVEPKLFGMLSLLFR